MNTISQQHIQRYYTPLLVVLGVAVLATIALIVMLVWQRATITVTVKSLSDKYDFNYTAEDVTGEIVTADFTANYNYTGFAAAGSVKDAIAVGTVTLHNETGGNQTLVKTTRLLSDGNVLFHTNNDTVVPANGTVDVAVYADQAGASGNIGPSRFEIVALRDALKPKIYATSSTAMTGGVVSETPITEEIITLAKTTAADALTDTAVQALQDKIGEDTTVTATHVAISNLNQTSDVTAGAIGAAVNIISTGTAKTIVFKENKLKNLISHDTGSEVKTDSLSYAIGNTENVTDAGGDPHITGTATLTDSPTNLSFLDVNKLTNKTVTDVEAYVTGFPMVKDVSVSFFPFWLQATPSDANHIVLQAVTASN